MMGLHQAALVAASSKVTSHKVKQRFSYMLNVFNTLT
jgi:hypothetical protein